MSEAGTHGSAVYDRPASLRSASEECLSLHGGVTYSKQMQHHRPR